MYRYIDKFSSGTGIGSGSTGSVIGNSIAAKTKSSNGSRKLDSDNYEYDYDSDADPTIGYADGAMMGRGMGMYDDGAIA